ncbi:MAG: 50S ribosomal protein L25 [Leptolinea sp.]|jgi:large subunit ribosomal protein L25|nr:50S ribosomal protein L25 [Leptolinea sp.]
MEKAILNATLRTVKGKKVGALRREGKLPAVLYGHHFDATPITLNLREASRILHGLTASSLVYINLEGKEHAALVREKQRDYLRNIMKHVDFQIVSLTEKIRADVPIVLEGVSPAVKDYNGVIISEMDTIEVEALPQDLPEKIILDISKLAKIGDHLLVKDILVSDNVHIHANPDDVIVIVTTTKEEEVAPTAEGETVAAEPEIIEKGKKEEEEAGAE